MSRRPLKAHQHAEGYLSPPAFVRQPRVKAGAARAGHVLFTGTRERKPRPLTLAIASPIARRAVIALDRRKHANYRRRTAALENRWPS